MKQPPKLIRMNADVPERVPEQERKPGAPQTGPIGVHRGSSAVSIAVSDPPADPRGRGPGNGVPTGERRWGLTALQRCCLRLPQWRQRPQPVAHHAPVSNDPHLRLPAV